jgi:hypothetical protein
VTCPHAPAALSGAEVDPAHLRTCADCAAAMREGEKLHRLLGRAQLPGPSPEALRRAAAPILADLRKPRPAWLPQALGAMAGFVAPLLFFQHQDAQGWTAALVALAAATLLAATAGALRAGALVALAASAGFALAAGGVPGFSNVGLHVAPACFFIELGAAALPLGAALWMSRRSLRPGALAQAAAAGALAGQGALNLVCGVSYEAPHLWTFHVAGVAAAALLGWILEQRLLPDPDAAV